MNSQKILKALSDNAAYTFEFDLTTGMVEEDIISSDGTNYTQKAGLTSPCPFNDFIKIYFGQKATCRLLQNSRTEDFSSERLLDDYFSGTTRREINLFYSITNSYYRVLYFLYEDEISGHIKAFVVGRAISQVENEIFSAVGQRKNQQQESRETFYKKLMDLQSCGVFAYSLPGYQVVTANAEALRMLNCKTIEDIQNNFKEIFGNIHYPSQDALEKLIRLRTEDSSVDYECIFNKGTEKEFYVIAKTKIVYAPNGKRIAYTTYVDVTEMHALQENVEKAAQGVRAKSEFLFNISHDLRTPMNAIIGYTELLQMNWSGDEHAKKYLSKLMDSSKFLMFLLNNAIELASLEKGIETVKESLGNAESFNAMLDAVIESALKERNLNFSRSVRIEHHNVMCDSMKLRIVFLNLLSNSIKYTPSGGSISMDLEEIPSDREGYAMYKTVITDTGIGISPAFLPHIFENFSRETNTTVSGVFGAGLGLSVAKKLVELMGGCISVESSLGKGTSVTVLIPHRIVEREELLGLTKGQSALERKLLRDKRLLLAEDNDLNAEIATLLLSDVGLVCERVKDGTEAVAAIVEKPEGYYDLVLMDIQMPMMDGYEATRLIRQLDGKKAQIPIIAITANAMEEDKKAAFAAGMNGHVAKPFDVEKLLEAMFEIFKP